MRQNSWPAHDLSTVGLDGPEGHLLSRRAPGR